MLRRPARLLLAALALGMVVAPAAAMAQEGEAAPTLLVAHAVDATANPVQVSVLTDALDAGGADVTLTEDGATATASVDRATSLGRTAELVFVVDTSERLAPGSGFEQLKQELASTILALPAGTRVAVVAAGDLALVRQQLTDDLAAAAASVDNLRLGTDASLWDAMNRGADQFTDEADRFRTMVAISSDADSSRTGIGATRSNLVRRGVQLVGVRHRGGEPGLTGLAEAVGGRVYGTQADDELRTVLDQAMAVARDRLVISYTSQVGVGGLADVDLEVSGATTSFSFTGGTRFDRVTSMAPVAPSSSATLPIVGDLFQARAGLMIALVLAVVGVGLAVFSLASMVINTDDSLDGVLSRYSGRDDPVDDDVAAGGLGSSAFMRRAVTMTENIARDRGILSKTEGALEKANLPLRPAEALFAYGLIVVFSILFALLLLQNLLGTLFVAILAMGLPFLFVKFKVSRRQKKFEQQLPDTLQLLAGTLRAGYSLPQGMEAVSREMEDPMGFELRRVMTEARLGRELEEALESAAARLGSEDFAWAVMAIGIQREVGGNLNELLMTVSDTMVARERLRGEIKTLTAEGKLSAIILGGLPPAIGAIMYSLNPGYITTLFSETMGHLMIGAACVSMTVGLLWMRKVITIDV